LKTKRPHRRCTRTVQPYS